MKAVTISTQGMGGIAELPDTDQLDALQGAVGGLIECIHLSHLNCDMWVNEEGKMFDLPLNRIATALFTDEWSQRGYEINDYICGDVIITGTANAKGETVGLTDEQVTTLLAFLPTP